MNAASSPSTGRRSAGNKVCCLVAFAAATLLGAVFALARPLDVERYHYSASPRGDKAPELVERMDVTILHEPQGMLYRYEVSRYGRSERVRIHTDLEGRVRSALRETRREGKESRIDSVWSDGERAWVRREGDDKNSVKEFELPDDQDLAVDASLLLLLRRFPFGEAGDTGQRVFMIDFSQRKVGVVVRRKAVESVSVPAGTFECYRMEVEVRVPIFKPKMTFWITTDPPHFMVRHEGRRSPFTRVFETVLVSADDAD